jgi:hypothetical protein
MGCRRRARTRRRHLAPCGRCPLADQKRWFKVWTSILLDPAMNSLELADVGRWVRLGALTAAVGESGSLAFQSGTSSLLTALGVTTLAEAKCVLARLPGVYVSDAPITWPHGHQKPPVCEGQIWRGRDPINGRGTYPFEEWCTRNGATFVTLKNWYTYQSDSTARERGKSLRSKRRREEKRGEEIRIPLRTPPIHDPKPIPASIVDALKQTPSLGAVPRLQTAAFWQATIRATGGRLEYGHELLKAESWLAANPTRAPRKDLARFVHNWMTRAGERA